MSSYSTEHPITLNGEHLTLDEVVAIADGAPVQLAEEALPRMARSRAAVEQFLARGEIVYGVTTGFGFFKDRVIPPDQVLELQRNLVRSHAAGVGPILSEREVRAMLAVRANTLAKGYSGVRPAVVETLIAMLNQGVHPVVPGATSRRWLIWRWWSSAKVRRSTRASAWRGARRCATPVSPRCN